MKTYKKTHTPKPIEKLTIADDFIFGKVLSDRHVCRRVLEALLGIKVGNIKFPVLQKALKPSYDAKGIRLDVFAEDGRSIYDIEIQVARKTDLPKRMRYYQSLLDVDFLMRGHNYTELKTTYIIFICLFDPFKKGLPVYEFERVCKKDNSIKFGDKSKFIVYNVKAISDDDSLASEFSKYVARGSVTGEFSQMLDNAVTSIKNNEKYRSEYMFGSLNYFDAINEGKRAGFRRGKKLGLETGLQQGIQQGMAKGMAHGARDKAIETAINALHMGLGVEKTSQLTGLSLAEVKSLASNN